MPIEINNLGIDASKSYAQLDVIRESGLIQGAETVSKKAQMETRKPVMLSSLSQLLNADLKNIAFAEMVPFSRFFEMQNRAFTYNIVSSIGGIDPINNILEMLQGLKTGSANLDEKTGFELDQLTDFFNQLLSMEQNFTLIESVRNSIHKA